MNALPNSPPGIDEDSDEESSWLKRARSAYRSSTTYIETNYRKKWEDSIRAFNSQHPEDSKYNSPLYSKRSNLYRPKTRAIIRKNEAAAAAAFFSNNDITSVEAGNMSDPKQQASAEIMKQLLQYRLSKSIPWFQIVLGGLQDAQKTGAVVARVYWDYQEGKDQTTYPNADKETPQGADDAETQLNTMDKFEAVTKPEVIVDKPCIKLIPIENIRIDPASDWMDPVKSSPYIIEEMPMWVLDVKQRMKIKNPKTDEPDWLKLSDDVIRQGVRSTSDTTNAARNNNREDARSMSNRSLGDYEIVWVQRHIHRKDGQDWEFYTLSDIAMLSKPQLLKKSVIHGQRDYVMGVCILETHVTIPSSIPDLSKNLQDEANEIANQRMDNVKLVLNKRWFVARGQDVDLPSLTRNVPGGITMVNNPETDIKEINWPDVTQSSYQEQDRINSDMDELLGNFNAQSLTPEVMAGAPARSMQLLSAPANILVEYLIRTYVETFIEPVLRMVVKLEQYYETDEVILGLVAERSKLLQKYGIDQVTDDLLNQDLTISVNVGMGATDPQSKSQKFIGGVMAYANIVKMQVPSLNITEIGKELFGQLGYQDGKRFLTNEDPDKQQMQQQMQAMQQQMVAMQKQLQDKQQDQQVKLKIAGDKNQTDITKVQIQQKAENQRALATHIQALSNQGLGSKVKDAIQH